MADNDQNNEEYEFADLDMISTDSMNDEENYSKAPAAKHAAMENTNVKRNALIAVGIFILAMLIYKFASVFFAARHQTAETTVPPPPVATKPIMQQAPVPVVTPPQPAATAPEPAAPSQQEQKLAAMELSQENVRSELTSVNGQINGINSNLSDLTSKINQLNQVIESLSAKLDQQSNQIAALTKPKVRPKTHYVKRPVAAARAVYYIQAIIPGRAWLIASNGSTITVREGSSIAGYGIVKLIDPNQGRVLTSSGQVIRFSQQDS
ncbi:type IVB secretion system protein IcmG/DotF [Legionella dresdenensis]|uniref:Type IVB secretion system protein IcmG/DotF n=1 Tax=Legionella dresdenensis TaxID=450200 RepID=A0ABV8CEX3_9GAMM